MKKKFETAATWPLKFEKFKITPTWPLKTVTEVWLTTLW